MTIEHKGHLITQSTYNNHVMIYKDGRMVFHANITEKKNKAELIEVYELYEQLCIEPHSDEAIKELLK